MAAAVVAAGLGAGVAFASFGTPPTTSHGSVGAPVNLVVQAAAGPSDLLPGGTGAAYFTVTNGNPFAVSFGSVVRASVASDAPAACPDADVRIAAALPLVLSPGFSVAAGSTTPTESVPGLVALVSSASSGCQGVTFTVHLRLQGSST